MSIRKAILIFVAVLWAVAPIEVSSDGKTFKTVVDKTKNDADNAVEFDEIKPVQCKYVKLTITGWPKDLPCGVIEFTVFGKPLPN